MRAVISIALLCVTLVLASCAGSPGTPASTGAPSLSGTPATPVGVWRLNTLGGQEVTGEAPVTATFGLDGSLTGSSGCNRFTGRFEFTGNALTVAQPLATTMMACEEALMRQEATFLAALQGARAFELAVDTLTVTGGADELVFSVESQELAGTEWMVTGYNTGTGGVASLLVGSSATVSFSDDGSVSGSGGCNTFSGAWSAASGELEISSLASTRMDCAEPAGVMEQEAALLAALETAATYGIEGGVLTIWATDGATAANLARA